MATKKQQLAQEVARIVGAGRAVALETVDFSDPYRPKTCLEVDFPILPVNQVAVIEGNAGKPIYQMSKWWARRRSSVFRAMLIAAATKAPDDKSHAARLVWDNYYANHQKKGAFSHLKVADIFMGGGTTLVEGSRLGMQMTGNDINPVAWFVVKQELADVDIDSVRRLLAAIEAEVKPQIMPFYACDGPNGEKGTWTHLPSGEVMGEDFDPLALTQEQRPDYRYQGPEIIYTFWAKHGPCQVTGCGHRTPIMSSPVMAVKTLTVKHWAHRCAACGGEFDIEDRAARMAPDVPLAVAAGETPYAVRQPNGNVVCPHCQHPELMKLERGTSKKVELTLLVHPEWLAGSPKQGADGLSFGGAAQDDAASTARWSRERASNLRLLEVRGELPAEVTCPETGVKFKTDAGTVPKRSRYACGACGTVQDVLTTIRATGKTGPMAAYAVQGYAPKLDAEGEAYGGRFFAPASGYAARQCAVAAQEWEARRDGDLKDYWPRSELPYGFMTHMNNGGVPNHGFTHWWTMFNPRQLLVHSLLLRAIIQTGEFDWPVREYVLGAFQQYLRNLNNFCIWDISRDCLAPHLSNNNFHPKSTTVDNNVFNALGRGNWAACVEGITQGREWAISPWEGVSIEAIRRSAPEVGSQLTGKSEKLFPNDPVRPADVVQASSTDLASLPDASHDLVITDPPFGGLLHYSELSDFFHVWLRLVLKDRYPTAFGPEYTPKALEAVANRAREPENPDAFYQRLLTQCWREAHRILKPGGILAFTFHHSEDEPWVAVLESLFDAGFYLEATYPIRSDETKGEGAKPGTFGSQTIEYDIIHVCRKRIEAPLPVSWARMRREVLAEVRQLQGMLENHAKEGLPAADLQVIRRGKALEYFSRHYGQVFVAEGRAINVRDALAGIHGLIDDDTQRGTMPPPVSAEPITRQFLRIFDGTPEVKRDQMQKFLRGSGVTPDDFAQRGWCSEQAKVSTMVSPLEFALAWHGKHRRRLTADLDQALVLLGACFEGSGIAAADTLKNENFRPHPALKALLEWFAERGADATIRQAARRALAIYGLWADANKPQVRQMQMFLDEALA
jgi:adenine-specific DNA methylase